MPALTHHLLRSNPCLSRLRGLFLGATALVALSATSFAQLLNNPVPTDPTDDFVVTGVGVTGPGVANNNTVNSLTFNDGTTLGITNLTVLPQTLTITSGVITVNGTASINALGPLVSIVTPGNLTLDAGTLLTNGVVTQVGANGTIAGNLVQNDDFTVVGDLTLNAGSTATFNDVLTADDVNMNGTTLTIGAASVTTITNALVANQGATNINGTLNSDFLAMFAGADTLTIAGIANIATNTFLLDGATTVTGAGTLNTAALSFLGDTLVVDGVANITTDTFLFGGVTTVNGVLNSNTLNTANGSTTINGTANIVASTIMDSGNFLVSPAGVLNGGSLLVNGGNLFVQGLANIINAVNLNGGTTIVDGTMNAGGGATVGTNGFLTGNGTINANLLNNGLVAPGRNGSAGTLTINGNFTQGNTGILAVDVSSGASDLLVVSGNANLDGTLLVNGGDGLDFGDQVTIIRTGNGINGDFDAVTMNLDSDVRGRFIVEGNDGILVIAPASYTQMAETDNQRNVAAALDSFILATDGDREVVSTALDMLSAEEYPAAFEAIMPSLYSTLPQISLEQTNSRNQMLAQRTNAIRLGARGFNVSGMELSALKHDRDGKSVMDAKSTKDVLVVSEENHWGVWVQGNGIFARARNITDVPNYRFDSGGFMGGLDYRWNEHFATGVYAGYQGTYASYANGSRTRINSTLFGTYATYDNGGFYVDAIVGGTYDAYDVNRSIEFGSVNRTARSEPGGGQVTAFLGTGYDWQVNGFTFGPLLSGQYTYVGVAGTTETGADSLDLEVDQQNTNSIRTNLGAHIAYTWKVAPGFTLIPEIRMTWQHEYLNNAQNINSSLDGGAGPSFDYVTSSPSRDSIFAGAGMTAQMGDRWTATVFWNTDFARKTYNSQMVSASLNFKF